MEKEIIVKHDISSEKDFKAYCKKLSMTIAIIAINSILMPYILFYIVRNSGIVYVLDDTALYIIQWILNDMAVYLVPFIACAAIFKEELRAVITPSKIHKKYELILYLPAMIFIGACATILTDFIASLLDKWLGTGEIPDAMASAAPSTDIQMTTFILFVCVFGPICEELIFRWLLLKPARAHGDWFAVLMTALVFGLFHGNFDQFPYAFMVGIILGTAAVRFNSIVPPLILHVANNTLVGLNSYIGVYKNGTDLDLLLDNIQNFLVILSSCLFYAGIISLIILFIIKAFKFTNDCCSKVLPAKRIFSVLFTDIGVIIALVLTALTFTI